MIQVIIRIERLHATTFCALIILTLPITYQNSALLILFSLKESFKMCRIYALMYVYVRTGWILRKLPNSSLFTLFDKVICPFMISSQMYLGNAVSVTIDNQKFNYPHRLPIYIYILLYIWQ